MKKIKGYAVLMLVITILIGLIFSSFINLNAVYAATGDGIDTQTTARQKLWYSTLAGCISNKDAWKFDEVRDGTLLIGAVSADHLRNGKWFDSNAIFAFDGGSRIVWGGGAYIESMVGGEYKDGKIYCGENNNKLVRAALSELGLSEREIICGANGKEGVMYGDVGKGWDCITAYDNGGELELDSGRNDYFANLVAEKTFGGNIPGGTLTALTDLETYYIYRDDFMSACAIGDPRFGDESQPYQIKILNEETGKFEVAGYAQRNTPSTRVYTFRGESKTCAELSNILNDSEYFDAYEERYNNREDYDDPGTSDDYAAGTSDSSGDDTVCYDNSGAIGWILCPVIKGISSIGESMWERVEDKYMITPAGEIFESGGGVEQGWGAIRDIANIIFVILILVVIFSQLTGVGIDNYGIKKIMPKLILVAVLVNLSYLLCEIAVDLSNILGKGLNDIFSSWAGNISSSTSTMSEGSVAGATALDAVLAGGGAALYVSLGGLGIVGTGLAVFGFLVSVVVALLTLFLILVIREAGIIIMVVVAPVAIVCYLLPNTEKVYKRWIDISKALLVVYPICGVLVGAGKLASKVLGGVEGMELPATLVQVLPFFLIPGLLKRSLAVMGNVGSKISSFGQGISGQANKALRNTDAMKASMQEASGRRIMRKAGFNAKTGELNGLGRLKARAAKTGVGKALGLARLQSARVQAAQDVRGKDIGAEAALTGAVAASAIAAGTQSKTLGRQITTPADYYEDQMASAAESGNVTAFETAIEAAIASGQLKDKDIAAMVRRQIGQTQSTIRNDGVRQNFYRKMAAKHGNGFLATDTEMRTWMQKSGQLNGSNYNLSTTADGSYAMAGGMSVDDIKVSDVQKMSGDSMASMITSGIISRGMAEEALAAGGLSDDKKIMLGAAANGAVPTGMNSDTLKNSAQALARNKTVNGVTAASALANLGVTTDQVAMWTAPRAEDVTIRDVSIRNAQDGSSRQTDVLQVR